MTEKNEKRIAFLQPPNNFNSKNIDILALYLYLQGIELKDVPRHAKLNNIDSKELARHIAYFAFLVDGKTDYLISESDDEAAKKSKRISTSKISNMAENVWLGYQMTNPDFKWIKFVDSYASESDKRKRDDLLEDALEIIQDEVAYEKFINDNELELITDIYIPHLSRVGSGKAKYPRTSFAGYADKVIIEKAEIEFKKNLQELERLREEIKSYQQFEITVREKNQEIERLREEISNFNGLLSQSKEEIKELKNQHDFDLKRQSERIDYDISSKDNELVLKTEKFKERTLNIIRNEFRNLDKINKILEEKGCLGEAKIIQKRVDRTIEDIEGLSL